MELEYRKFTRKSSNELITFLTSQKWPYHGIKRLTKDQILKSLDKRYYTNRQQVTFLIYKENKMIAYVRIHDLINDESECPLFDIRIDSKYRGKGFGTQIVPYIIKYIFKNYSKIRRIEAQTRDDNIPMQKILEKIHLECRFKIET